MELGSTKLFPMSVLYMHWLADFISTNFAVDLLVDDTPSLMSTTARVNINNYPDAVILSQVFFSH